MEYEKEKEKIKIISNKDKEYLSNVIGSIYSYTEYNYLIPIKPSELEITLNFILKRKSKNYFCELSEISIKNISYNSKRNLKIKSNYSFNIKPEFSIEKEKSSTKMLIVDFSEKLRKEQTFQPENFSFYFKEKEIQKFEFPKNKINNLFFYSRRFEEKNTISESINFIEKNNYSENFETIYYIILINKIEQINIYQPPIFDSIKFFKEKPNKYKLIFLENESNNQTNIFDWDSSYFFITNSEQKIITLSHLSKFQNKIRKIMNKYPKKDKSYYLNLFSKLYYFLTKRIIQLPYICEIHYKYSIKTKLNDEFNEIIPIKLLDFNCEGELKTNEYTFLINTLEELNYKKELNNLKELESFNINIPSKIICTNCNEIIPEEKGLYYCYWCNIFFCEKCTEEKLLFRTNNVEEYKNNLIHKEHNLIYFTTRNIENLQNLDKNKLGNNLFATSNNISFYHNAMCNGCERDFNNMNLRIRYLCINCRPGKIIDGGFADYCFECINNV